MGYSRLFGEPIPACDHEARRRIKSRTPSEAVRTPSNLQTRTKDAVSDKQPSHILTPTGLPPCVCGDGSQNSHGLETRACTSDCWTPCGTYGSRKVRAICNILLDALGDFNNLHRGTICPSRPLRCGRCLASSLSLSHSHAGLCTRKVSRAPFSFPLGYLRPYFYSMVY